MTEQGRSEQVRGVAVGVIGVIVIPSLVAFDLLRMRRDLGRWPDGEELVIGAAVLLTLFIIPSLLVAIGSHLHAASGKSAGRAMVSAGSLILIPVFLLFTVGAGYGALYLTGARFLLTLMAVLTWVASRRVVPGGLG